MGISARGVPINIRSSLISELALQPEQRKEMLILPVVSGMTVGEVIRTPFLGSEYREFRLVCQK
jgi:hypothetical protein